MRSGTVVCAIDDWERAGAAVTVARRLAERFDARLVIVGVAGIGTASPDRSASAQSRFVAAARWVAERELDGLVAGLGLAGEDHRVAAGEEPAEAVAEIAAEEAADVIVVGGRGAVLGAGLRSSLARELAATASCPVVVAPPECGEPVEGRGGRRSVLRRHGHARGGAPVQE